MIPMDDEALRRAIDAAVEAREDGDYEDSVEQLAALQANHPDHPEVVLEHARSLQRVKRHGDADAILFEAMSRHPDHAALCRAWSQAPTQINHFAEVVRRAEIMRARFVNDDDAAEWSSLCVEFDALYESAQWSRLSERLDAYWDVVRRNPVVLPAALVGTGKLFQPMRTRLLCEATEPQAWRNLPPELRANLDLQTAIAVENQKLAQRSGYRVVSLGQNCLPYQLLGRWGLVAPLATPQALTPFDLGGFTGDHAAAAIRSGFSFLDQRDAYHVVAAWGGGEMLSHRPTGLGFFHERGPYWIDGDRQRFFDRIRSLIAGWEDVRCTPRRLFVFCLCGAGDPAKLVQAALETLLGPEDRLLVVDVLAEPHEVPRHAQVVYRHCPYPRDYDWTDFAQQGSNRGLCFELGVVEPVAALLQQLSPRDEAAAHETAGRQLFLQARCDQAQANGSTNGSTGVVEALQRLLAAAAFDANHASPSGSTATSADARAENTDAALCRAVLARPDDIAMRHDRAIAPGREADWMETLSRTRQLREEVRLDPVEAVRITLPVEFKALRELGAWEKVLLLAERCRDTILGDRSLFEVVVETLHAAFARQHLRALLAAGGSANGLTRETIDRVLVDLDTADRNGERLHAAGGRVLCIGQDATGFALTGRWGLQPVRTGLRALTFFDLGDFEGDATAVALEEGLASFMRPNAFNIVPAWFGGLMPLHRASGTTFYLDRRPRWGDTDLVAFTSGLFENIERWRQARIGGRRTYLFVATRNCNLPRLVDAFRRRLAENDARLVLLDLRAEASPVPDGADVRYLRRVPPAGWDINLSLLSPDADALTFERSVIDEILHFATGDALLAAE